MYGVLNFYEKVLVQNKMCKLQVVENKRLNFLLALMF